ncbi:cysteine desulfurase [Shewanella sp. AS1]|uniref:aminotransferase class V-fold PLP-dependent enzyme n=1 Tax=Shewanella sp. AS1 TaxID=2907626 RepID=UPI001F40A0BC|nr:cysteine desulfurase [Shewanella sp. AS1]MCE9677733.1 cysteine desulfurase [Shewanella sp. AS1]
MDLNPVRSQFPALAQTLGEHPLCYLDTAATSQKPQRVIDAINEYYQRDNANVHRAAHQLSSRATAQYEAVRDAVQGFIKAERRDEIIFTHGTTEGFNLLAHGLSATIEPGDLILLDSAAHHANIVPWQMLAKATGARIQPIPLDKTCRLDQAAYQELLAQKPAIVSLTHVSNVMGTRNPIETMLAQARAAGAITVVDGAQAIAHLRVDVTRLGCDFYLFSAHKMYGPTGIGILYGRFALLDTLAPLLTGGEMIKQVSFEQTTFNTLPNRLEAGTPPISAVIGMGEAIAFLNELPRVQIQEAESELLHYLQQSLKALDEVELIGAHPDNIGAVAFNLKGEHHQDVGILLDQQGVAVRCGHHCAMPLMQTLGLKGCCRASLGVYSNKDDIDRFICALKSVIELLQP